MKMVMVMMMVMVLNIWSGLVHIQGWWVVIVTGVPQSNEKSVQTFFLVDLFWP